MKVLVIVKATPSSEAGELPDTALMTAMGKYNEELVDAGIMLAGEGLKPSSHGARVHFAGTQRTVMDGPFTETKELVAGFWVWQVRSLEEAVAWVKKCPNPMKEDSIIEIRPMYEAEDFGEAFTPELREQEAALRAATLGLGKPAFQEGPALALVGVSQRYTMATRGGIPEQWSVFVHRAAPIANCSDANYYGVSYNCTENGQFDYLTAIEVGTANNLPADFTTLKIPVRRYAVFNHAGHVSTIPQAFDIIWRQWAPESGLAFAHAAPCYERYTPAFNATTGLGGMELWIPLQA